MSVTDPALFYSGLIASLYTPLRSFPPDADYPARFIERHGQPALELGCGTGDPILELRRRGFDVDGIDASADMLAICQDRATALGLVVDVREQRMESFEMGRAYSSIFLAGPTFNVLPDDMTARATLGRIAAHLTSDGVAMIPLFVPDDVSPEAIGEWKSGTDTGGRSIRVATIAAWRDEAARTQTSKLRYERRDGANDEVVERDFVLHWYSQEQFRALAVDAGLNVARVIGEADASAFVFWLTKGRAR